MGYATEQAETKNYSGQKGCIFLRGMKGEMPRLQDLKRQYKGREKPDKRRRIWTPCTEGRERNYLQEAVSGRDSWNMSIQPFCVCCNRFSKVPQKLFSTSFGCSLETPIGPEARQDI